MAESAWRRISTAELDAWDDRLLEAQAPFSQLSYWNEPYRYLHLEPVYLVRGPAGAETEAACVLVAGVPGFRFGTVQKGPVSLVPGKAIYDRALDDLRCWALSENLVFLRVLSFDRSLAEEMSTLRSTRRVDPLPFWHGVSGTALLVDLDRDEQKMLSGFQSIARYEIRAATKAGYEIASHDDPEVLRHAWHLLDGLAARKGISFSRPFESWADMIRRGQRRQTVNVYTASLAGKVVQFILIVRDANTAEYILGALDLDAVRGKASPACLLHWHAMRDSLRLGCRRYDLGPPSGPVFEFKRKFRPTIVAEQPVITFLPSHLRYQVWSRLMLEVVVPNWPQVRSAVSWGAGVLRRLNRRLPVP
ncbi:MAG: GNAT family N-acetyltransferase [Myxococcales bacterium]